MSIQPLHELVAATHSPFHSDSSIAPEVVSLQASFLALNGIRTVFITGSTGECHSLSTREKLVLYDAWATAAEQHDIRIIAHVGGNCLEDSKLLAARAEENGFRAISAMSPSYFKPGNIRELTGVCQAIASAAPATPFYFYHIPSMTGVHLPMEQFLIEAKKDIPTLAGIKFTNPDLISYRRSLDVAGSFDLPWGVDEMLLAALATGAKGGVGSTFNFAPGLYRSIIAAHASGDLPTARKLQSISIRMIDAIASTGFMGTTKALMERLGVPVGPVRLPQSNPEQPEIDRLLETLLELGFSEWGAKESDQRVA